MGVTKSDFHGDPNVGLSGFACDKFAIVPDDNMDLSVLSVPVVHSTIGNTNLVGLFIAGNSNGIIMPWIVNEREEKNIRDGLAKIDKKINVAKIKTTHTCLGNLVACNDKGAIISPEIEDCKGKIEKCLKVPVVVGKMLDLDIVGSLCVATNKGFLLSINAEDEDYEFVKKALKVDGDIGSVNFGGAFVRSGLLANSKGAVIGKLTSGPETARIEEALGYLEE